MLKSRRQFVAVVMKAWMRNGPDGIPMAASRYSKILERCSDKLRCRQPSRGASQRFHWLTTMSQLTTTFYWKGSTIYRNKVIEYRWIVPLRIIRRLIDIKILIFGDSLVIFFDHLLDLSGKYRRLYWYWCHYRKFQENYQKNRYWKKFLFVDPYILPTIDGRRFSEIRLIEPPVGQTLSDPLALHQSSPSHRRLVLLTISKQTF